MNIYKVLYNPLCNTVEAVKNGAIEQLTGDEGSFTYEDITAITDISAYLDNIDETTAVIIAGGDGTLNHLVNNLDGKVPAVRLLYYPGGSGNDFFTDVNKGEKLIELNKYIVNLPTVTVEGKTMRFINGVGFGIDGYCCEEGDKLRAQGQEKINYASIAIKGMMGSFKQLNATVTVDGVEHKFSHVWLAPTMIGRYYGGGMEIAPAQDRLNEDKLLSVVVLHIKNKLKTLITFPSLFKGEHVNKKGAATVLTGKHITVSFDKPTALQVDGETVSGVLTYTANAAE